MAEQNINIPELKELKYKNRKCPNCGKMHKVKVIENINVDEETIKSVLEMFHGVIHMITGRDPHPVRLTITPEDTMSEWGKKTYEKILDEKLETHKKLRGDNK